ncbi:hypothetical protein EOT10_03830 [Streptomyces antnestii]|uniref:Uncharacterized protein n=1 Tax=Streptomyces antnestii TaxID=2494256 RepID=A0A3S2WNF0_9ACTN|nr:hypothetical protein [Streptomyces sp. San01]RVU28984.1 hypothetical protein EOT10_03830 [Streptomyces sp. San01]
MPGGGFFEWADECGKVIRVGGYKVNAVELCQADALNWIEFETLVCHDEWEDLGFGEFGARVKFGGILVAVENGHTRGRAWSRVRVRVTAPVTGKPIEITSVLGGHITVTLTDLDG